MSLDDLRSQFVVDDDVRSEDEALIQKALPHCVVREKNGSVEIKRSDLAGRHAVKLVLAARLLASKLDDAVASDVTVEQVAEYTGLPKDQAAARAKECLDERFAERSARGSYRARLLKVEEFLDSIGQSRRSEGCVMNTALLVVARKRAEEAVADMPDGELKVKAFEVILSSLLAGSPLSGSSGQKEVTKRPAATRPTSSLADQLGASLRKGSSGNREGSLKFRRSWPNTAGITLSRT